MTHQKWIEIAERVDSLRIFPRIIMIALFVFMWDVTFYVLHWYTLIPTAAERTVEASGVASSVVLFVAGLFKMALTNYLENGRDWNSAPPVTQTTTTMATTTLTKGTDTP